MASKASMLKSGANKASSGLFAGMTPLSKELNKKPAEKETKVEKKTEEKPVKKAAEPKKIVEEAPVVEKEPVEEVETVSAPVEAPVAVQEVAQEVVQPVMPAPQPVQPQPVVQQVPVNQYTQAPVQQMPVNQYPNVPVQPVQPQQIPAYSQPVNNYQQPVMMQQTAAPAQTKQDKSRYEKEKFLLLDIRGYRDYVEHMAKASNMSATKYIRSLIDEDMKRNMDIYMAHKQLEETLRGRR